MMVFWQKERTLNFTPMNIKELNEKKVPVVKIDKSLDKYNDVVLFPEKLEKANQTLQRLGLTKPGVNGVASPKR